MINTIQASITVMKKTKAISLILVSAALASCQRNFVPARNSNGPFIDSALLEEPEYAEVRSSSPCISCCQLNAQNNQLLWNYSFNPIGNLSPFPVTTHYYYHWKNEKSVIVRGSKAIVRSGWGTSAMTTSVVS
jgi:hypothetical protein